VIAAARLPAPQCNVRIGQYEVDAIWRAERLIVEVDGFRFHGHRAAFERDRVKDAALVAAGYRVVRVAWRQLTESPLAAVATIACSLTLTA
jgi:very-short-patch-repair endonuclease